MKRKSSLLFLAALTIILSIPVLFASSCSEPKPTFRVAVLGFPEGEERVERNFLLDYACQRVEAELGADVELIVPRADMGTGELFGEETASYQLVISLGKNSTTAALAPRPEDSSLPLVALDFQSTSPLPGEEKATIVRYRVEEGAYVCGFLAGWLTSGKDHPLTNSSPVVAFMGVGDDPLTGRYQAGFTQGVKAANPGGGVLVYHLGHSSDYQQARASAEEAVKKGADILFCTPGFYDQEVLKVAEAKGVLVIPVGWDRSEASPEHVLTSLVLRDDNAVFRAVDMAMRGELSPGRQEWGIREGTWCLAPFRGQDIYIRRELKEALRREEEKVGGMSFPS